MAMAMGGASGVSGMIGSNMGQAASRSQLYEQADQAEASIADIDLQAAQRSEARALQLSSALSTITARRAASGLDLDSPTAMAIERQIIKSAQRSGQIENASANQQRAAAYAKANVLRKAGYQAGRLLDLKFGLGMNPGGELTRGASEDAMYGGGKKTA
jgi:hypothetical protein